MNHHQAQSSDMPSFSHADTFADLPNSYHSFQPGYRMLHLPSTIGSLVGLL